GWTVPRRATSLFGVSDSAQATSENPARRRDSWSLKTLVENVAGRPIGDFQEPGRPEHPYLKLKAGAPPTVPSNVRAANARPAWGTGAAEGRSSSTSETAVEEEYDPVARVYPPLAGATGRSLHGSEMEHHHETLHRLTPESEPPSPGARPHSPGPSRRPERIYLHYLLLHIDRLTDSALVYLKHAVDEELANRTPTPP
ncbi:MAG: hypothetical protein L3J96_04620, partial [Thermoplasmata archaeon]|nr:hypothetical protein [Thermoplasmata archaeon]